MAVWAGNTITWSIVDAGFSLDGYYDDPVPAEFVPLVRDAFDAWSAAANLNFVEVENDASADIRLGFVDNIDGLVLGEALTETLGGNIVQSDIHFDSTVNWALQIDPDFQSIIEVLPTYQVPFLGVAVHEIGHALGLGHVSGVAAIMNTTTSGELNGLQWDDIERIRALYGRADLGDVVDLVADQTTLTTLPTGSEIAWGESFEVTFRIFNDGTVASAPSTAGIYLSGFRAFSTFDRLLGTAEIPAIAPGATYTGTATATVPEGATQGDVNIGVIADITNIVPESIESNNGSQASGVFAEIIVVSNVQGFIGTDANELWHGGSAFDVLEGFGGNDTLYGEGGNDIVRGDAGNDLLFGGDGNDNLFSNGGFDTLFGGDGEDNAYFDRPIDVLTLGVILAASTPPPHGDALVGTGPISSIFATVTDTTTGDVVRVADDVELLRTFDGDVPFDGMLLGVEVGMTVLAASADADTITGTAASERLVAGIGKDVIDAGDGDDQVIGDWIGISRDNDNDTLKGDAGDDTIWGQNGNDVIFGGEGNDALRGNLGGDEIFGAWGNDSIKGHLGNDYVGGGEDDDDLSGGGGDDTVEGQDGDDTVGGNSGRDVLRGGAGNDVLRGHGSTDALDGEDGDDTLVGHQGFDTLNGGNGNDLLIGGDANDTLIGGPGNDTLTGGTGADRFEFIAGHGTNIVSDFEDGTDSIHLQSITFDRLIFRTENGNTLLTVDGDTLAITFSGVAANQLTQSDFTFG